MLVKTTLTLLTLGTAVTATFGPAYQPECWKKCARDAGVSCDWSDTECVCEAANAGLLAKANSCACSACSDRHGFGGMFVSRIKSAELSMMCKFSGTPLDKGVDGTMGMGSCDGDADVHGGMGFPPKGPPPPKFGMGPPDSPHGFEGPPKVGGLPFNFAGLSDMFSSFGEDEAPPPKGPEEADFGSGAGSLTFEEPHGPAVTPPSSTPPKAPMPKMSGAGDSPDLSLSLGKSDEPEAEDSEPTTASVVVTVPVVPVPAATGSTSKSGGSSVSAGKGADNGTASVLEFAGSAGKAAASWASGLMATVAIIVYGVF